MAMLRVFSILAIVAAVSAMSHHTSTPSTLATGFSLVNGYGESALGEDSNGALRHRRSVGKGLTLVFDIENEHFEVCNRRCWRT